VVAELVYETERVKLWFGDAGEVLPTYKTECFDLVVTDPPYGVEFHSNMRKERFSKIANDGADEEARGTVTDLLLECVRLVGQNRHLYVFGPEALRVVDAKVSSPAELVWDRGTISMGDLTSPWGPQHEKIHFYTSLHRHAGKRGKETGPVRLRKGSVLRYSRKSGLQVRHPTEKPVELLTELLESSSRVGEVVLDPFAGVGSTGVAAILGGRRAVLCEVEEKYVEIAVERLGKAEKLRDQMSTL
jgi:site-specific DNA-methyltransferase (adenine-specific)